MRIFAVVRPSAGKESVEEEENGILKINVKETPEKGKANAAAAKILAEFLKVPVSAIKLVSGASSRKKIFEIAGL